MTNTCKSGSKLGVCFGKGRQHVGGKGENAGYQHFLLFPKCFPKGCLESGLCYKKLKHTDRCTEVPYFDHNNTDLSNNPKTICTDLFNLLLVLFQRIVISDTS